MIYTESTFTARTASLLFVLVLLLSACTSQSSTAQDPVATETTEAKTPVAETPTATPAEAEEPTATPTEVPAPEAEALSDSDMIALARSTFDADPQPGALIAWDHLDATAFGDRVRLEICSWTGDTVFDDLRTIEYEIRADGTANYLFDGSIPGDCLNTELIDSALAFTREFDSYWGSVLEDPTTFDPEIERQFSTDSGAKSAERMSRGWIDDGTYWIGHAFDSGLPQSSLQPIGYRRYQLDDRDFDVLELATCRELAPNFGLYRGEVLIDDERSSNAIGPHAIDNYQLTRLDQQWVLAGIEGLSWADCFAVDWQTGLTTWQPQPVDWDLLS